MKRKTEKAYFNELWDQMEADLQSFIKTADQEKLHRFRVQVKKLRAFLTLVDTALSQTRLTKEFKPVKKIFKHGGKIREAYINLQLSSHYDLKNDDFILKQVNHVESEMKNFTDSAKKYLKTVKDVHGQLEDRLEVIEDEQIKAFYKNQLDHITIVLDKHEFGDELHDCRKKIKTLVYNRKIAAKALDDNFCLNSEYLDKLQGCIGDWHDSIIATQLFSAPELNAKPVVAKIKRQTARLRKSIRDLSGDFLKKATSAEEPAHDGQQAKA